MPTIDLPSGGKGSTPLPDRLVFFDGECGLCNHTVDFLLRRDTAGRLMYAPLQGVTAAQVLPAETRSRMDTMAYYRCGHLYYRSSAIVRMLRDVGGVWAAAGILLWVVPAPLRNVGYRAVSALRYRIFGRRAACRIPTAEERERFLD